MVESSIKLLHVYMYVKSFFRPPATAVYHLFIELSVAIVFFYELH